MRLAARLIVFTLVCLVFTAWLAFTIGNIQTVEIPGIGVRVWGADRYELTASYDDATGLIANDNVKIAGVVVGKVTKVGVEKGKAVVTFQVDRDVDLPTDTETAVRWRNLLGQRYVYLYPGEATTMLEGGDRLPLEAARPIVDLGELFNRLGPIVQAVDPAQANEFLQSLTAALEGGNDVLLAEALGDLGTFAEALGTRDEAIGRMVENLAEVTDALAARDLQIRTILDNITALTTTFNENSEVVASTVDDLGAFSDALGRLIAENRPGIDRIITRLADVVGVVDQRLTELESTVAGLDEFSLGLFRAASYGEWLNQFIPCIVVDVDGPEGPIPPLVNEEDCTSESTTPASSSSAGDVRSIMGELVGAGASG